MFRENTEDHRFEWEEAGAITFADYYHRGEVRVIRHVEAPMALRGTGSAGRLMQAMADHARAEGIRLAPVCGYAVAWFRRHRDAADVLG